MWTEFEWENKVNVNTSITDLREYLAHIMKSTNMSCLTPEASLAGEMRIPPAQICTRGVCWGGCSGEFEHRIVAGWKDDSGAC